MNRKRLAQELRDMVLSRWPHLAEAGFQLDILIDRMADVRQLRDYIDSVGGPVSPRGQLYKPLEMLRGRERDVLESARDLLLAPRELAKLSSGERDARRVQEAQERLRARIAAQDTDQHPYALPGGSTGLRTR